MKNFNLHATDNVFTSFRSIVPTGIEQSDFVLSSTLLQMEIELQNIQNRLLLPMEEEQLEQTKQELEACKEYYTSFLSVFN